MEDGDDGGGFGDDGVEGLGGLKEQLECTVCGSTQFFDEAGFYFCTQCNTQSQQSRQYVDENIVLRSGNLRQVFTATPTSAGAGAAGGQAKSNKETSHRKYVTSWEVFNLVLKAMTEKLIQIGFPDLLRDKVFQLWSAYLVRREVLRCNAGSSKNIKRDCLPSVTTGESAINMRALFKQPVPADRRYKRKREKKDPKLIDKTQYSAATAKRLKTIERRKAFEEQFRAQSGEMEQEGDVPQKAKPKKTPVPYTYTKSAKALRYIYDKHEGHSNPLPVNKGGKDHRFVNEKPEYRIFHKLMKSEDFKLHDVYVLLFVSLRQIGCKVLFTDILRLVADGTLWIESLKSMLDEDEFKEIHRDCNRFLSANYQITNPLTNLESIDLFLQYIGLHQFQYPTFKEFLPKFIDELALPKEFECLLAEMNKMFSMEEDLLELRYDKTRWKAMIEIPILCFIGAVLRMLFAFDDITERHQSKFAKTVNLVMKEILRTELPGAKKRNIGNWNELFVLEDWFAYLRYRKRIVSAELFNSKLYVPNRPPNLRRTQDIITRFGDVKVLTNVYPTPEARVALKTFLSSMVEEAHGEVPEVPTYVSLQTATESVFQEYRNEKPNVSYPDFNNHKLLNMRFDKSRIDWVWKPQKYIPILEKAGYKVEVIVGDATNHSEVLTFQDKVLYVFQPYKYFDDYVHEQTVSHSLSFLIDVFKDALGQDIKEQKVDGECHFLLKTIYHFGELYCKRSSNSFIPLTNAFKFDFV